MRFKSLTAAAIATSMVAMSPTIAVAQTVAPASKLSIAHARAGASAGESRLEGGSGGVIALALLAGIAAIGVLAIVNGDDSEASPVSA
jgi:hypothetical protein